MLRVTPYPLFVERVSARRGANDFAAPVAPLNEKKIWDALGRIALSDRNYRLNRVRGEPIVKDAVALWKSRSLGASYDRRLVAVAEHVVYRASVGESDASLVQIVAKEHGVAEMIAMKLLSACIVERGNALAIDDPELRAQELHPFDESWKLARAIASRADDAEYVAAREVASAWRKSHPGYAHRIAADYFFPEENAWAREDLGTVNRATSASPQDFGYAMMPVAATVGDAALVLAFLARLLPYQVPQLAAFSCDFASTLPPADAMNVLCKLLEGSKGATQSSQKEIGIAMCALEGEEMARELAGLLLQTPIGPMAVDYFRRFPDVAKTALAKVTQGTSKAAEAARTILAANAPKEDLPLADASEIPSVLRDAPWRAKKKTKPVVFASPPEMPPKTIEWAGGERERERHLRRDANMWGLHILTDMTAQIITEWLALARKDQRSADVWSKWDGHTSRTYRVPDGLLLKAWNENVDAYVYYPLRVLAIHGEAAYPGLFARDPFKQWSENIFEAQLHVIGPETARIAAEAVVRRKAWRRRAQAWIGEHASVVAQSLLPAALGKESKERTLAVNALRIAARASHDVVMDAARALGADAERGAREIIDGDPREMLDVKGKIPPFLHPENLPPLVTRSGKRLPLESSIALLEILRSTTPDSPYPALDEIREALSPSSLGDFAWAIVLAWVLAGSKASFDWVPMTLAHIGDDACTRRFAPYVREWSRKDAKKAMLAADALAAIGTSAALLHLSYVADKSRFDAVRAHAKAELARVAAEQGLTIDELTDRTVPDLDLDSNGKATLDFGPRKLIVTLDEGLRPIISSEDGATLPAFPRGTKADDAALVKAASARFKGLKADADSVAQSLLRRFELAMIDGRSWRADAFRTYVVDHPLVGHIAKRLVWRVGASAFRVAEDRSFADLKDAKYTLLEDALVSVPHPLELGKDQTIEWARVFSDYAVVQPFEQLARATFALAGSDDVLTRFAGRTSKAGPLLGSLTARGWNKTPDDTTISYASKTVRRTRGGTLDVSISFSPGIEMDAIATSPEQTFDAPNIHGAQWEDVHPIDLSELARDLEALAH